MSLSRECVGGGIEGLGFEYMLIHSHGSDHLV